MKKSYISCLMLSLLCIAGCKSKLDSPEVIIPADELYKAGVLKLEKHDYYNASRDFAAVFFQHPGSTVAPRSELMEAYALYMAKKYDDSIEILNLFQEFHPTHPNLDYALYLKAINYYDQIMDSKRNNVITLNAKDAFDYLISHFPNSKFTQDAKNKITVIEEALSDSNMVIGRMYLNTKNPIAAMQRFQEVISKYKNTIYTEEALYRMVECSLIMGLEDLGLKYFDLLNNNYSNSNWTVYAGKLLSKYKITTLSK